MAEGALGPTARLGSSAAQFSTHWMDIFQGAIVVSEADVSHLRAQELLTEFFEYERSGKPFCWVSTFSSPDAFNCMVTTY